MEILTGVLITSLFWLVVIFLREMQFNDAIWDARDRTVIRDRTKQAVLENCRDYRRAENSGETADALREAM